MVFLSPPWGGPSYLSCEVFDLETMVPLNGVRVFEVARSVTRHVVYYLPRNIGLDQVNRSTIAPNICGLREFVQVDM